MVDISGQAINIALSFLFTIIAILLIMRTWRYLRNELRIAPRIRVRDRFWIGFSMLLFSVILTAVILFVAAMISSTIIKNRAQLGVEGQLSILDPELINAFEFASFNTNRIRNLHCNLPIR
jgi:heme/copper-type cytochrome/quinol oxidase subunit 4